MSPNTPTNDISITDASSNLTASDGPNIALPLAFANDFDFAGLLCANQPKMHQKNFKWRSQRQVRKNRRRAHAAGVKGAFGK